MEIKNLQTKVDNWIKEHGVRYFNELTNMAQLTEEVGEVARIIARKYGEQSFKKSDEKISLDDELSDVLFVFMFNGLNFFSLYCNRKGGKRALFISIGAS